MKQKTKPASFRLPKELLDELRDVANKAEVTQAIIVCEAVSEKLQKIKGKKLSVRLGAQAV